MSTKFLIHISDLHFGKIDNDVLDSLLDFINKNKVDCVVITGDITQRAKSKQFSEAVIFLKKITSPVLAIPGNHDVPLYNLFRRFFKPFARYNFYIKPNTMSLFHDDDMVIVGMTTNNIFRVADGQISEKETAYLQRSFKKYPNQKIKIIACHHPVFKKASDKIHKKRLQDKILDLKPQMILSGHDHVSSVNFLDENNRKFPLLVNAGTGTSTRLRDEPNSINLIEINSLDNKIKVQVKNYQFDQNNKTFTNKETFEYEEFISTNP